jgi:hypothetical protein
LKSFYGIEWLTVVLAIAFIDPSSAMLLLMFGFPLLLGIHFLIKYLVKRKLCPAATPVLLSSVIAIYIICYGLLTYSPQNLFKDRIMDPIPESIKNIETHGSIGAMGSSSFRMTFEVSPQDLEAIVMSPKLSSFQKIDLEKMPPRVERCLSKSRMEDLRQHIDHISDIYVFIHPNSKYRCDFLLINKGQSKVLYGSI